MFEIRRTVGCSSLGPDGRLTLGAAADFMQDCSVFQLGSLDALSRFFEENHAGMYLVSRQIDLKRRPSLGENCTVRTLVYQCNRLYGCRNTLIFDEAGKPCALSWAAGAFVDLRTARPLPVPEALVRAVPLDPRYEMEYLPRKIRLPRCPGEEQPAFPVPRWHIDANRHVNNARYLSMAEEYLPEGFGIARVRVEYKTPAKAGDRIRPVVYRGSSASVTVSLCGETGSPFAVVEFTAA